MNQLPKISIVTPSYNQGQYLERTILSVLQQDYSNLEYIVIDGGSTDHSVDIIESYSDRINYWISEPDSGQAEAINKGFKKATGEIVAWINSDDFYRSGVLQKVAESYNNHQDKNQFWLACAIEKLDERNPENNEIYKQKQITDINEFLVNPLQINQQGCFWSKEIMDNLGYLDEHLHLGLDTEYFLRFLANDYRMRIDNDNIAAVFRIHEQSKTANYHGEIESSDQAFLYDWTQVYLKYLKPSHPQYSKLKRNFQNTLAYCETRFSQNPNVNKTKRLNWLIRAAKHAPRRVFSKSFASSLRRIIFN